MRILLISEPASAGVGRHIVDLSQGLLAAGHDVHLVYSPRRMDETFASDLRAMSGLKTTVMDMRRAPHPSDLVAAGRLRSSSATTAVRRASGAFAMRNNQNKNPPHRGRNHCESTS